MHPYLTNFNRIFARRATLAGLALAIGIGLIGCPRPTATPAQITSAFTIGTIALETGDPRALAKLSEAVKMAPDEPAIWANLGLYRLRKDGKDDLATAAEALDRATSLLPTDASPQSRADLEALLSILAAKKGDPAGAVAHMKRAVELVPSNLINQYALANTLEKSGDDRGALQIYRGITEHRPNNLEAWLQALRLAAKLNDKEAFQTAFNAVTQFQKGWPQNALEQVTALRAVLQNPVAGKTYPIFLRNTLKQQPEFRLSYAELNLTLDEHGNPVIGKPMERFVRLPNAPDTPAPPDMTLTFTPTKLSTGEIKSEIKSEIKADTSNRFVGAFWESNEGMPADLIAPFSMYVANQKLHIASPAFQNVTNSVVLPGSATATPGQHGILALDFDYDLHSDLFIATPGGLKLYLQPKLGEFTDATAAMKLPDALLHGSYTGAWGLDYDSDGDLDILLAPTKGHPLILRNNGDGTFLPVPIFTDVSDLRSFAWVDLDGDGTCDAAMIDANGALHVAMNQRSGQFKARPVPTEVGKCVAVAAADIDHDGRMDLIVLKADGSLLRITDSGDGKSWQMATLGTWPNAPADLSPESATLIVADLDNNGSLDIVASSRTTAQVWLNDGQKLTPLPASILAQVQAVADLDGKGRLDLLGFDGSGQPVALKNHGTRSYFWQDIRPRADQRGEVEPSHKRAFSMPSELRKRTNSFGIGGEIDVRAGLLYQKHLMTSPSVHVGLGEYPTLDAARILWPNGDVRGEFEIKGDGIVSANHRINVSCPFLFTWNGDRMEFVTDCIWRSPVGLKINAQQTAGVQMTEDWVKIRGEQLVPRQRTGDNPSLHAYKVHATTDSATESGTSEVYDLRITAELWETHFFDHLALMVVDHPDTVEIFCDERFAVPAPPLRVYTTTPPRPVSRVCDDSGTDVTEIVARRDGRYIANFPPGIYAGVTRDHWLELEFGDEVFEPSSNENAPLYLIANGWIWPTNSNINVAISQGDHPAPQGISIETLDADGNWVVRKQDLGFPAGKVKTVVLRIDDLFMPDLPRRLRLRTNLEIYWDSLQWAAGLPDSPLQTVRLDLESAELQHRGFSQIEAKDARSPELPLAYEQATRTQKWRDLIGYYTAYGDVLPLLRAVDDRYVIMNAGDELRLTFPVPPPPAPGSGWKRDFVLIGDGWVKDGNYNTTYSRTVLPLPAHDIPDDALVYADLENDPVYRRHATDWQQFHTRYVTPARFRNALRPITGQFGLTTRG